MENNDIDGIYDIVMEYFKVLGQLLLIYSEDEGVLNSKKLQAYFKGEGIEYTIKIHVNQVERMIRTIKKVIVDRLRINKDKTWVDMYSYVIKVPNDAEFSWQQFLIMGRGNQGCILCAQIRNQLQLQTVLEATISSGLYPNRDQW